MTRYLSNSGILAFIFLVFLSVASCNDPCNDIQCGANGTCLEGLCACEEGYEGNLCEFTFSDKFVGSYAGAGICEQTGQHAFPVNIFASMGNPREITFLNLYNQQNSISANISTANPTEFEIPSQPLNTSTINGFGEIDTLTGDVSVTFMIDAANTDSCNVTLNRQ